MREVFEHSEVGVRVGSAVAASDDDGDALMYSLVDSSDTFTIEEVTGQILVNDAVLLVVDATFIVTVEVSDQRNSSGDVDAAIDAQIDVTITVLDVNDPPVVSGPKEIDWPETATGVLGRYTAVDPENERVRLGLGGFDLDKFTLSDQGELTFHSDYEVDYESQNTFLLRVVAFDGELTTRHVVLVRLTDVDEPPGIGVVGLKADYPENEIERVVAFLGLDPEGADVSWELSGDDAGVFRIQIQIFTIQPYGVSLPFGILDFRSPPDYEAPTDVRRWTTSTTSRCWHWTRRGNSAEYDLTVTVTDVANAVSVSFGDATHDVDEGDSVDITVTLSDDPDQTVVIPLTAAGRGGLEDADYSGVPANVTFSCGRQPWPPRAGVHA